MCRTPTTSLHIATGRPAHLDDIETIHPSSRGGGFSVGFIASSVVSTGRTAGSSRELGLLHPSARSETNPRYPVEMPASPGVYGGYAGHQENRSSQRVSPVSKGKHRPPTPLICSEPYYLPLFEVASGFGRGESQAHAPSMS